MTDLYDITGERLKARRTALELRQADVAAAIECAPNNIYLWENGRKLPSDHLADRLSRFLADREAFAGYAIADAESTSAYRLDRLAITFRAIDGTPGRFAVMLADSWTGMTLEHDDEAPTGPCWRVVESRANGWFRVRGEAVAAAIATRFDPDA